MFFKANVKQQVTDKFRELFGKDFVPVVRGERRTPPGKIRDVFVAELLVDGDVVCSASHPDWRKAYKLLKLEVEKLYEDEPPV